MEFIAVVEDHREYRLSLVQVLKDAGFQIADAFGRVSEALECRPKPALILLDIGLPEISGIEGIPLLKMRFPGVRILMLTNMMDDDSIFAAIRNGADGYLLKNVTPSKLAESVRETLEGGASMSPGIARKVLDAMKPAPQPPKQESSPLSERELEILKWIVQGKNGRQVAELLFISFETVRTHVRNIYEKLHVNTRSEVVAKAMKDGLV
jgi:DNA-binding NarL/FixJ family response regulator